MNDAAPVIRTFDLTKRFGRLTALDGVNLEVRRGGAFGFVGPNGAGKTTTIPEPVPVRGAPGGCLAGAGVSRIDRGDERGWAGTQMNAD